MIYLKCKTLSAPRKAGKNCHKLAKRKKAKIKIIARNIYRFICLLSGLLHKRI